MFSVLMTFEDGGSKRLDHTFLDEAKAEASAFILLGTDTHKGVITQTYVLDAQDNVLNEFEF